MKKKLKTRSGRLALPRAVWTCASRKKIDEDDNNDQDCIDDSCVWGMCETVVQTVVQECIHAFCCEDGVCDWEFCGDSCGFTDSASNSFLSGGRRQQWYGAHLPL